MIKRSRFSFAGLAVCALLAACFTSQTPLFGTHGTPLFGTGDVIVTDHEREKIDDSGVLHWQDGAYVDPTDKDHTTIAFFVLPGTWPWDGWYVAQTQMNESDDHGYIYELYRKRDGKLLTYSISCRDLTPPEAAQSHLVRKSDGDECVATRKEDLAAALRLLSQRKAPEGYWTWKPAPGKAP